MPILSKKVNTKNGFDDKKLLDVYKRISKLEVKVLVKQYKTNFKGFNKEKD